MPMSPKRTGGAGRRKPAPFSPITTATGTRRPTPEAIAKRPYELYVRRGGVDGYDVADWLAAERELSASTRDPAPRTLDGPS